MGQSDSKPFFFDENAQAAVNEYCEGIEAKEAEGHEWTPEQREAWLREVSAAYEIDVDQLRRYAESGS